MKYGCCHRSIAPRFNPNSEMGNEIESTCREPIVGGARHSVRPRRHQRVQICPEPERFNNTDLKPRMNTDEHG